MKTKRADVRITELQDRTIRENGLSKTEIFDLGYEIMQMTINTDTIEVTVKVVGDKTYTVTLLDNEGES